MLKIILIVYLSGDLKKYNERFLLNTSPFLRKKLLVE